MTTQNVYEETTHQGVDKLKRYGWNLKDRPGEFRLIHKRDLVISDEYQRDAMQGKVSEISAAWSWIACGAITVGDRDGKLWVIDGQHRVLAARRRSDIENLPCIVFVTWSVREEAVGFLDVNAGRKAVSARGKFKARIAAGDNVAVSTEALLRDLGLEIRSTPHSPNHLKCIDWVLRRVEQNEDQARRVLGLARDLCARDEVPIPSKLLDGLYYIDERLGLDNKNLCLRIRKIGADRLVVGATKAASFYSKGGARVYAQGMMEEINKGMRNKFDLFSDE